MTYKLKYKLEDVKSNPYRSISLSKEEFEKTLDFIKANVQAYRIQVTELLTWINVCGGSQLYLQLKSFIMGGRKEMIKITNIEDVKDLLIKEFRNDLFTSVEDVYNGSDETYLINFTNGVELFIRMNADNRIYISVERTLDDDTTILVSKILENPSMDQLLACKNKMVFFMKAGEL